MAFPPVDAPESLAGKVHQYKKNASGKSHSGLPGALFICENNYFPSIGITGS